MLQKHIKKTIKQAKKALSYFFALNTLQTNLALHTKKTRLERRVFRYKNNLFSITAEC